MPASVRLVHPALPGRHIDVGVDAARVHRQSGWVDIDDDSAPTPPPKNGRGSGRDAWADYAKAIGIPVAEDDSRDDLIAKTTSPQE